METLLEDRAERAEALRLGQSKARQRRVRNPRKTGRPLKASGVYYRHSVLVSEETFEYISKHKLQNDEPLGSVLHRLLMRKKVEAPANTRSWTSPIDNQKDDITSEYIRQVGESIREKYHGQRS